VRHAVGGLVAPHEVDERGDREHGERQVRGEDQRHVDVHDPLHLALRDLARRDGEGHDEAGGERGGRKPAERSDHGRQPSSTTST